MWIPLVKGLVICASCGRIHTEEEAFGGVEMPTLLKMSEAATLLRVAPSTLKRWIKEGRITAVHLPDGRIRVPSEVLGEILEETPNSLSLRGPVGGTSPNKAFKVFRVFRTPLKGTEKRDKNGS